MSVDLDLYFNTAIDVVKQAGELIKQKHKEQKNIEAKSCEIDLVTETDQQVEKMITSTLLGEFPGHKYIGEESVADGQKCVLTDDPTWILDPIDGTMNFVHSFPQSCISLALLIKKETLIGIIYNPVMNMLFTARAGKGTFCNGERVRVSGQTELEKALICFEAGTSRDPKRIESVLHNFTTLVPKVHGIRSLGAAAMNMAMVAYGGADAYYEFGIHCWDVAAGDLIIREAGGVCLDTSGGPMDIMNRRLLCASSNELAQKISKEIKQIELERD